ncbi:MAG: NAD(P)/FAD-dependent oxidoreductase [Anaplasmataceae bacterium]|nr:NAD(P)/FAD-dependent oxidoreductase [Anaplasmataceae bacterium]
MDQDILWDVIVIGGGPAGMMAAGRAGKLGAKVLLVEKNNILGKKLLITGGGRCNLTNAEFDTRKFLSKFNKNDKFLFSAFARYGVKETLDFFHEQGLATKIEAELRVFPTSNSAASVQKVLIQYMKKGRVTVLKNTTVSGFVKKGELLEATATKEHGRLRARSFVLATGGKSRPETGSTGEGFSWLKKIGHTVKDQEAALVPIAIKDAWVKKLQGVSLSSAKLTVFQNNIKQDSKVGKLLFTHFGLSGPLALNMSRDVGELLKYGDVSLSLDIFHSLDVGALDQKIQGVLMSNNNKHFKNVLGKITPSAFTPVLIDLAKIKPDTFCNSVTKAERGRLVKLLKNMPMSVSGLLGRDKAIVTSGGVELSEVDFKTMQSKKINNLYLVGDVLNIDRPSGGYSLQLCWTTGFVSGTAVAEYRPKQNLF